MEFRPPIRTGNPESPPGRGRNHTRGHERRRPASYEARGRHFWKGLQRVARSCRDNRVHLHNRVQLVRLSSQSTFPRESLGLRQVLPFHSNKDLWGPDAYEFRPERWFGMNEEPESHIGVYGNL